MNSGYRVIPLEYFPKGDLSNFLGRRDEPDTEQSVDIIESILLDLRDRIHGGNCFEGGILHMDIKPRNVLMASDNEGRLCDYDISLKAEDVMTSTGFGGTEEFMSPEVRAGQNRLITYATDLFSVGRTMWCVLANKQVPSIIFPPNFPEEYKTVYWNAVTVEVADRFQTADDFLEAIRMVRSGGQHHFTLAF